MRKLLSITALAITVFANAFAASQGTDYIWTAIPDHSDWLYKKGEKPVVEVQLLKYGVPVENQTVKFSIALMDREPDSFGEFEIKNGKGTFVMPTWRKPGFREAVFEFTDTETGLKISHHITLGFDADKITPYTQEPKDFKDFWDDQVRSNHEQYPMDYSSTVLESHSTEDIETSVVKMRIDNYHQFYCFLSKPRGAAPRSCPVMLISPGAGMHPISPNHSLVDKGFITMNIEIHGIDPFLDKRHYEEFANAIKTGRYHGYLGNGVESRDRYYLKHVYLGLVRCIDLLTSLPEWDGKNVIAKGGSQGGALSLVIAGLDKRVTLCVPRHPALADMCAGMDPDRTGGYPHFERNPEFFCEAVLNTLPYFDVVNFARHIECPTFMTWGYNDGTCPTSYNVWNVLCCPKKSLITPINEHWSSEGTDIIQNKWIIENLK